MSVNVACILRSSLVIKSALHRFAYRSAVFATRKLHFSATMATKPSILDVMKERPIIGDGSYVITLEKRGYVQAGCWTPEAVIEYPDAVKQLHKDFQRAGSDVLQLFTFYATDSKPHSSHTAKQYTTDQINEAAIRVMEDVADSGTFVCGGISPTPAYKANKGKDSVQTEFKKQCDVFQNKVDFVLGEFFGCVEEAEWAIEVMKDLRVPVACSLRMGPTGDMHNIPPGECAVRMTKAGSDIIGLNCQYDPNTSIKTMIMMKDALDQQDLRPFLMIQALGFHVPEAENLKGGYHELPEFPYCLEPRLLTRFDCRRYAREAYDLGVRYIGGCCGFEPYHIREIAEELSPEMGKRPPGADKSGPFGEAFGPQMVAPLESKSGREFWMNLVPATGRPNNPSTSKPKSNYAT